MIRYDLGTSIKEIANHLIEKKSRGQRVGLFLGHRTGVLFNDNLYKVLIEHSQVPEKLSTLIKDEMLTSYNISYWAKYIQTLDNLSAIDKFSESYRFLGKYCSEYAIYRILRDTIPTDPNYVLERIPRDEDDLLAELVRAGFFETIITTNIDALLEEGLIRKGLKWSDDYQVITAGADIRISELWGESLRIVKIFGDLSSQRYCTVGTEFDLEFDQPLKRFIISELEKDFIMLGYDPLWDWPVERAFREKGRVLWYVNEEPLAPNSHLAYVLDRREARFLVGPSGRYRYFLRELYNHIGGEPSLQPEAFVSLSPSPLQSRIRKNAFISYSHKNKEYLERLKVHLRGSLPLESESLDIHEVWDDTNIDPGRDWYKEIHNALARARVAVLLLSADFMASEFVRREELPSLLQAAESGEMLLIPVILGPCSFQNTPLARFQTVQTTKPLMGMLKDEQETIWAEVAEQIYKILSDQKGLQ